MRQKQQAAHNTSTFIQGLLEGGAKGGGQQLNVCMGVRAPGGDVDMQTHRPCPFGHLPHLALGMRGPVLPPSRS